MTSGLAAGGRLRPLVVNSGLGADSTAWLLKFMALLPWRRAAGDAVIRKLARLPADADLDRVVVVTAMTGSEHPDTVRLFEQHILPRLAAARLPYAQVARGVSGSQYHVALLDFSYAPTRLHADGALRLYEEMVRAGTVPTTGLTRMCSIHAKGWPIDGFLRFLLRGRAFIQVMGFEDSKHERKRALRDAAEGDSAARTGAYPLIELEWDRDRCQEYITAATGVPDWPKSACGFCPYAIQNRESLAVKLADWRERPELAVEGLVMDHIAVALNPAMGLVGGRSLRGVLETAGLHEAVRLADEHMNTLRWGVYEVRRGLKAAKKPDGGDDRSKRGFSARDTRRVASGTRAAMLAALEAAALGRRVPIDTTDPNHPRVWIRRRGTTYPARDHLLVAAPALVDEKTGPGFGKAWAASEGLPEGPRQLEFGEQGAA